MSRANCFEELLDGIGPEQGLFGSEPPEKPTPERPEAGLTLLEEAFAVGDTTSDSFCEAELYRLQGALTLQTPASAARESKAEACFQQAISVAQQQEAKSWELRAATSLARMWQQQGKQAEARALLAPVYNWFTEGFDTADLKDAKALLDSLT